MSLRTAALCILLVATGCVTQARQKKAATHTQLGVAYLRERNVPSAIGELQAAVKADPRNWAAQNKLGLAYLAAGATDKSVRCLEKAVQLNPTNAEVQNNYGLVLMRAGRVEEAVTAFEVAIEDLTYRRPSLPLSNLGHALYLLNRNEEAVRVLDQAVARAPNLCEARFNRGLAWEALGKAERALEDMEAVIALCGEQATGAYLEAGQLLLARGDRNGACTYLLTAVEGAPGTPLAEAAQALRTRECT